MFPSAISRAGIALCLIACSAGIARGQQAPDVVVDATEPLSLQLEVYINEVSTGLVGGFRQLPDGRLLADSDELKEVGIKPPTSAIKPDGTVLLNDVPDLEYSVVPETQRLYVIATDTSRMPKMIDLNPREDTDRPKPQSSTGAVLNYSLFSSTDNLLDRDIKPFQGISGGFDARFFSPFGKLNQSFTASLSDGELQGVKRLNTTWSYSDPERMISYRAGDFVSGGLGWTRPVYLGGMQIQRNFSLRSDLVTLPMPVVSGSAAVPSTLEVYTGNVKTYSGDVPAGPFELANFPVITGAGEARVVLKDTLGRETQTTLPFYASSELLRQGLVDFSAEIGFPRRNYGTESNDYASDIMGTATVRYGLTDRLTLESHVEGGADLINGGVGAAFPLGAWGATSLAVAGSQHDGETGVLLNGTLELSFGDFSIYGRMQRTFGAYDDVASVSVDVERERQFFYPGMGGFFSARVPRSLAQVSVSAPVFDRANINLSFAQSEYDHGEKNRIVSASYGQSFFRNTSFYASAFKDLDEGDSFGIYAGLSISFDNGINVSTGMEQTPDGPSGSADISKSSTQEEGSFGWRANAREGNFTNRSVAANYRSTYARVEGQVQQYDDAVRASAWVDGAIAVAGGGVFATNRIDDAFAVVDVGAPDVDVTFENRPIGRTNGGGRLLIPDLTAYHSNQIAIDPKNLPVDAAVGSTRTMVVPADGSGVVVDFDVKEDAKSAIVAFVDGSGKPLDAGLLGKLEGSEEPFIIGYDGEAYIQGLVSRNNASVELSNGKSCQAQFPYAAKRGTQILIKNVVCQ